MKKVTLLLVFLPIFCWSQQPVDPEEIWADSIIDLFKGDYAIDVDLKKEYADSTYSIYSRLGRDCKKLNSKLLLSSVLNEMGHTQEALSYLIDTEKNFSSDCDSSIYLKLLANYAYVFLSIDELARVDSVCGKAIRLWKEDYEDKEILLTVLNNLSISKAYQGELATAGLYFKTLLNKAKEYDDPRHVQRAYINLGNLKGMLGDLDSAYYFIDQASKSAKIDNDLANHVIYLNTLANIEEQRWNREGALSILDSAYTLASSIKNLDLMSSIQVSKANINASGGNYELAYNLMKDYVEIKSAFLDEERVKAVTEMTEKYESEKNVREIQDLKLVNLNNELENARISKSRNLFIFIGLGVILFAFGLWSRLTSMRKSHIAIQKERDISEGLLLNILPASVAEELKSQGHADARHFDQATIIFSDFKDFTGHAETMDPSELVNELHICFKKFDDIITKFNVEKIKTIGDSYMAAGGLPELESCTVDDVILAAFEMQEFVSNRKKGKEDADDAENAFEMRVGIHTGPVVAGIVGVKKFQYDIWGDTVNTAARMESSGAVGQVNISEVTYELVKDNPKFKFEYRGMVEAKGKGKMKMYFVSRL